MKEKLNQAKAFGNKIAKKVKTEAQQSYAQWKESEQKLQVVILHCFAMLITAIGLALAVDVKVAYSIIAYVVFVVILALQGWMYFLACRFDIRHHEQLKNLGLDRDLAQDLFVYAMFIVYFFFHTAIELSKVEPNWGFIVLYLLNAVLDIWKIIRMLKDVAQIIVNMGALQKGLLIGLREIIKFYDEVDSESRDQ